MISYDNVEASTAKVGYIKSNQLAGAMWWEASGDRNTTKGSLVDNVVRLFGALDNSENCLDYPDSVYANIKAGMPDSSSSSTASAASATSAATSATSAGSATNAATATATSSS